MIKKRPQLNVGELHQLKWGLGSLLAAIAAWGVFYLEIDALFLIGLVTCTALVVTLWPSLPSRVPPVVHRLAFPAIVAVFVYDLYAHRQPLSSLVRLELMLLFSRLIAYRRRRDDLQLIVLGLLLLVVMGVYTASPLFAVQILAFTACALGVLLLTTLADAAEMSATVTPDVKTTGKSAHPRTPPAWVAEANWRRLMTRVCQVLDWRIVALGSLLFGGVLGASAFLFMSIPRFEIGSNLFLDGLINKKTYTGFSDNVTFGDVADIQEDDGIAMTVDVSDPALLPGVPYWRMVVLDEYSEKGFRASAELNRFLSESMREQASNARGGLPVTHTDTGGVWSFFFEPGVSRYLPLGGSFGQIVFSRPVSFSINNSLRMIALKSEPSELIGFRIHNLQMSAVLKDLAFAGREAVGSRVPDFRKMEGDAATTEILRGMVREFAGDGALSSEEFARRACEWLWARHSYSLQSTLPSGNLDPLVRWLQSGTPGHCEYFAGSFALLAHAAGYPVRIVTGFKGGSWNAFSNSLIVRHTHAHAWCELWNGTDAWIRVDPTPGTAAAVGEPSQEIAAAEMLGRTVDEGWGARLDSLRVFWYRRIVSFDQKTQVKIAAETRRSFDRVITWVGKTSRTLFERVKSWLEQPWSTRRLVIHVTLLGMAVLALWLVSAARRSWGWRTLLSWRPRRGGGGDPVRCEATRWLQRIRAASPAVRADPQIVRVRADLERLRFGPRSARVQAGSIFNDARRSLAKAKRAARRSPAA